MTGIKTIFSVFLMYCAATAVPMQAADESDQLVTVLVLSKQVRLLREGRLKDMVISPQGDSSIIDEADRRSISGSSIRIEDDHGRITIAIDSKPIQGPVTLTITDRFGEGSCRVKLGPDKRIYSLPFTIRFDSRGLRFYASERLSRYAVDSALAEYGSEFSKESEAILALAHVVRARYFYMKKEAARHKDADFCDLTHCQVYRGRIGSGITFNEGWMINHEKIAHNLFFHSRCGGNTFSEGVFSAALPIPSTCPAVKDWLYREGEWLCRGAGSRWERTISREDLRRIIAPEAAADDMGLFRIEYDRTRTAVYVQAGGRSVVYPVDTFRLKINRVRGWNFIRSNNFSISEETVSNGTRYRFRGEGLGHGVGMCQHGALALSRRGYSRYDILEHYFPDLKFESRPGSTVSSPDMSYCIFNLASGNVLAANHGREFLLRKVPPGSIFKLIVALYLAAERPDLFNDYTYVCHGKNSGDAHMPGRCWTPKGHGVMRIEDAIAQSCNLYFASLYDKISEKRFRIFYGRLCRVLNIAADLPEISDGRQWSKLLAGLDFRISFTISDYMHLAAFFNCGSRQDENMRYSAVGATVPDRLKIFKSLRETFISGTGSERLENKKSHGENGAPREEDDHDMPGARSEIWGKTSTITDGTNKPLVHGLFIGGSGTTGIVAVIKRANGHTAARRARMVLLRYIAGE